MRAGIGHRASGIGHRASGIGHRASGIGLAGAATLVGLLTQAEANAAGFTQRTCSSGWYDTPVSVDIGSRQFPTNTNDSSSYHLNTDYSWRLYANSNVKYLMRWVGEPHWDSETWYDRFYVTGKYGEQWQYHGYLPAGLGPLGTPAWQLAGDATKRYLDLRWYSDSSVTRQNFPWFSQVLPMCEPSANPTVNQAEIPANRRIDGVLLGAGDVIYLRVVQPAYRKMVITLDVLAASVASADFDLYVSYATSTPDNSSWDLRGYNSNPTGTLSGAGESLTVPGDQPLARMLYIGVRAYNAAGHFTLHAHAENPKTRKVCTPADNFGPGFGHFWTDYQTMLKRTSLAYAQATQGGQFIESWNFYTTPACEDKEWCQTCDPSCEVCMTQLSDPDACTIGQSSGEFVGATVRLPHWVCSGVVQNTFEPFVLAHEFGHALLGLPNEYSGPWLNTGPFCGHSLMNGPGNSHILCTGHNHCRDPRPGFYPPLGFNCSSSGAMWELADMLVPAGVPPWSGETADPSKVLPDNYWAQAQINVNKIY
ncbi:MAG: hypothetical protein HS104_18200 [Polyangiaceae bacterium]|nr:hypothetical protein [Polyangiaceae bacterium]MBK9001522.1 hypothetical protein [Myxococcales bacterium]